MIKLLQAAPKAPIVGIDVGEDFLDVAIVDGEAKHLRLERVAVAGVERGGDTDNGSIRVGGGIGELRRRILAAAPELGVSGAIALVDSPRWPRDLDLADDGDGGIREIAEAAGARKIDRKLLAIVNNLGLRKASGGPFSLSLFPTPRFEYFAACVRDPHCKPHLAGLGRELFGDKIEKASPGIVPAGGRVFTRFMLTGFAAYRAIDGIGVETYEAYPDLAFRLWAIGVVIPPKSAGRKALDARGRIDRRLAEEVGCQDRVRIATLDEADAAVLALSAARARCGGAIMVIEEAAEGRFALAMDNDQTKRSGHIDWQKLVKQG